MFGSTCGAEGTRPADANRRRAAQTDAKGTSPRMGRKWSSVRCTRRVANTRSWVTRRRMPTGELSPDGVPPDVQILLAWVGRVPAVSGPSGLAGHEQAIVFEQREVRARNTVKSIASFRCDVFMKEEKGIHSLDLPVVLDDCLHGHLRQASNVRNQIYS